MRHRRHRVGLFGNKERIDLIAECGDLADSARERLRRIILDLNDTQSALRRDLLEFGRGDTAVIIIRDQRGEGFLALARGVIDDAIDIILDQERQEIDARRRGRCVGREGDDRLMRRLRNLADRAHTRRKKWPENNVVVLRDRLLRRRLGAIRRRMVVHVGKRHGTAAAFGDRKIGGIFKRGADNARGARRLRQWQDHCDTHAAVAGRPGAVPQEAAEFAPG